MAKNITNLLAITIALTAVATIGCDENERVAKVAIEAADRQERQNTAMVQLSRDVSALQRGGWPRRGQHPQQQEGN